MTRRLAALVAPGLLATGLLATSVSGAAAADAPKAVTLQGPADVRGLEVADFDGDGVKDLFLLGGREVRVYRGRKDAAPAPAPTWTYAVPPDATFVSRWRTFGSGDGRTPALLALANAQAYRLVPGKPPIVEEGVPSDVPWSDERRACRAALFRDGALLLPTASGFRWIPDANAPTTGVDVSLPPRRKVVPAGPFVEDRASVSFEWPALSFGRSGAGGPASTAYGVGDDGLHAFVRNGASVADLVVPTDFLGPVVGTDERRLLLADFDGDDRPDFVHEAKTNKSGTYAFFRTPEPAARPDGPPKGPVVAGSFGPARALVRLTGFQLPADYVDLDGDGRPDFVVTTIEIDGTNVMSAALKGLVVAKTKAFLNRAKGPSDDFFAPLPDAERTSEIGIRIQFSYSGAIEVTRSYTIVTTGDFDGDRRKDLAVRTGPDRLSVWRGAASGVWEAEASEVRIPAIGKRPSVEGYVGDLDADGKDDLVLLYRAAPGGADETVVLRSP